MDGQPRHAAFEQQIRIKNPATVAISEAWERERLTRGRSLWRNCTNVEGSFIRTYTSRSMARQICLWSHISSSFSSSSSFSISKHVDLLLPYVCARVFWGRENKRRKQFFWKGKFFCNVAVSCPQEWREVRWMELPLMAKAEGYQSRDTIEKSNKKCQPMKLATMLFYLQVTIKD